MFEQSNGGVCAPAGFVASGIHCGIRKNKDKADLALIYSETECAAAAVYTQNKVKGSPIVVTRKNLQNGKAKAIICNSGNANTCNADGEEKAQQMCAAIADVLHIDVSDVIVASTGVIGQPLPIEPILTGVQPLVQALSADGSEFAAKAIMTTDLKIKEIACRFAVGGVPCTIGAIAKGSGMIHPNMATMLSFVTTDAAISPAMLQKSLSLVVDDTYNMVSVDGDTSTNDMLCVLANGLAGNKLIDDSSENDADFKAFTQALLFICTQLSKAMAADGEGATKLLECCVTGAPDRNTARAVAKSVITSSLFKAAMFGCDANWGRILCAIGYTEGDFDITKTDVDLSSAAGVIAVCRSGAGVDFDESDAKTVLEKEEIGIQVNLHAGEHTATAWGCDLTYDYVKINGDYRT